MTAGQVLRRGELPGPTPPFVELLERIRTAGLLDARPAYYALAFARTVGMVASAWALVFTVADSWWQLLAAAYLALGFGQTALLLHDTGHAQVARSRRVREWICYLLGNVVLGVSAGWWVPFHNRHHGYPNRVGKDPDVVNRPIVVVADQATGGSWARRAVIRYQAAAFVPMLTLDAIGFRVLSLITIVQGKVRRVALEALLVGLHVGLYVAVLGTVMSAPKAVAFAVVHHAATGLYLGMMLAPNHKGMAILGDDDIDWVRRQVLTSRNVRGGRLTDFLFGGLNYQIEHHLFPTMPRPNLRQARPLVRAYCSEHGLPYHEVGFLRSHAEVATHLRQVSRAWRRANPMTTVTPLPDSTETAREDS